MKPVPIAGGALNAGNETGGKKDKKKKKWGLKEYIYYIYIYI